MRPIPLILAFGLLLPSITPAAEPAAKPLGFDTHDGYFVSNQFEPAVATSFVVIKDQEAFDKVFGVARVMGDKSHRLPRAAFDTKWVVAAIHRGKAMLTYQVESVVADDQTLIVRYTTQSVPSDSAEFACPLIISIDKGDYKIVRFAENGKKIKRLELVPPQAFRIECQKPDTLTEQSVAGKPLLSIQGDGIGHATVTCTRDQWPQDLILRAHLRGLESLTLTNERVEWKASVLSHSGQPTLLHLRENGKDDIQLDKNSPYWTTIQSMDASAKPVAGLPPENGWFEIHIPQALLTDKREIKLAWIDFYR